MNSLLETQKNQKPLPSNIDLTKSKTDILFKKLESLELQQYRTETQLLNEQTNKNITFTSTANIIVLPTLKKVIQKLKRSLVNSNISLLDEKKIRMINDAAYILEPKEEYPIIKNAKLRECIIKLSKILKELNNLPVLAPYDNLRLFWDLLQFILLIFLLFWIPFEMGFAYYLPDGCYTFFFVMFIFDIFVNMNTAYIVNGFMVKDRILIYRRYIKNYLISDIITSLAFSMPRPYAEKQEHILPNSYYFVFHWLFFLRIKNFINIYDKFLERIYSKFNIRDGFTDLINLIFMCFFIIQVFASFWHFLAEFQGFHAFDDTWMTNKGIADADIRIQYVYSFYWSAVTIMTVGYGDICPQNWVEAIFVTFAVMVGCMTTAFIVSSITEVANQFRNESRVYKQNLYVMNKFMNRKKINSNLQMKVRQYLKFIWQEESTQNSEMEESILNKLSKTLKDELYTEANGYLLYKHSMFFANFSELMLRSLMYYMKEVRYNPGDVIFQENDIGDSELFFLIKGNVQISSNSTNRYKRDIKLNNVILKQGAVFGEMGFFAGQKRSVTANSKDFTSIVCIKRDDFLNVLKQFPQDYERYCQIRDQLSNEHYYMAVNLKCMACNEFNHLAYNCPLMHYAKERFLTKYATQNHDHKKRHRYRRKKYKDLNALLYLNEIQLMTSDFQENEKFYESPLIIQKPNGFEENCNEEEKPLQLIKPKLSFNLEEKLERLPPRSSLKTPLPVDYNRYAKSIEYSNKYNISPFNNSKLQQNNEENKGNNEIEGFEKYQIFNFYKRESNYQKFRLKHMKTPKNLKNLILKTKFQNFFIEKKKIPEFKNRHSRTKIWEKTISDLKNLFGHCLPEAEENVFGGGKLLTSNDIELMNFYDLVYEVMTNIRLRKKLLSIKNGALKQKKSRNKNKLI